MSHPALESLRVKIRLTEFWRSDKGRDYAGALASVTRNRMPPQYTPSAIPALYGNTAPYATAMAKHLDFATPYWVDSTMVDLTVLAAESRPLDPIHNDNIPTGHGFAVFERPGEIRFVQPTGEFDVLTIKAFLWGQGMNDDGQAGIALTFWSDVTDQRDTLAALLAANDVDPFTASGTLVVCQTAFIPYGHAFSEQYWWAALPSTFFNLISQPIVSTTSTPPDKLMLKHAKRAKVLANTVAIITLRRASAPPPEFPEPSSEPKRSLSVRFMVGERTGGFWRRQPTRDGVKPIWIQPFWKGPEAAPIQFRKDKIYAWKR